MTFPGGDLRTLLKSGYGSQTWLNLGRWAYGILNDFPDLSAMSREETLSWNDRAAFINLKKLTGKASSYSSTINAFAFQDRELLRKQIRGIRPSLIIACGVFDTVVWLLKLKIIFADEDIVQEGYSEELGCRVIAQRHPSRANPEESYRDLKDRVNWCGGNK